MNASMTGPVSIPFEEAARLCKQHRTEHGIRLFSQCWGCVKYSKEDPTKMCLYHPPDNRGCRFVNQLFDR